LHLVANSEAKNRIIQMGEVEENVKIIGSPDIDVMKSNQLPAFKEVKQHYEIPFDEFHVVMFHPVTTEHEKFLVYAKNLVDVLIESKENYIVIYPNNDHGSNAILDQYKRLENLEQFRVYPSIKFEAFLTLIENAKSMIGNSSAGIREAPIYGVPSINIGTRQNLRYKNDSIIDCTYEKDSIKEALNQVLQGKVQKTKCEYFGSGNSAEEFKKLLLSEDTWSIPAQKVFVDVNNGGHNE
jgi:UDP-N-acetylglucosamine 2-epimerase (hydrolysing)